MNCCKFLAVFAAIVCSAYAYPAHNHGKCNITQAMRAVTKCWLQTDDGKWLSGNDVLDVQEALRNADWQSIYETGKTTKNLTLIGDKLLGGRDAVQGAALGLGLVIDDAVYGDNAVATRAKMCNSIRELLSCGEHHAKQCDDFLTDLMAKYIGGMLGTQSALSNVDADSVADMLDKKLCFLCKNDGEAMKIVMETMLDPVKRKKLREYTDDAKRDEIYKKCAAAQSLAPAGTKVDKDYVKNLVASDPCAAQPYAACVANDIHTTVNPGVELNVIGILTNLTFTEAVNCTGISLPASFDMSKCPKTMHHGDHAHHNHHEHTDDHKRRRRAAPAATAAGGESCDSAKAIQDTMECFVSSDAGGKITGPEGLDIQDKIRAIKWKDVVANVRKYPGNLTKVREVVYEGKLEKAAALRMKVAMWMDQAVYGDDSAQVLTAACNGLKAALNCLSNLRPCKNRYDRLLVNALNMMSGDYTAPSMNVTGFAKLADKEVCYLCNNNAEGLKAIFKTLLDGEKRKAVMNLVYNETSRMQAYRDCPAATQNGRTADQINKEYLMQLAQEDVCQVYPFAKCLADDVHELANKDVTTSYMGDLNAIMFRVLFNCNDVEALTAGNFNMNECKTALAAGADA